MRFTNSIFKHFFFVIDNFLLGLVTPVKQYEKRIGINSSFKRIPEQRPVFEFSILFEQYVD